MYLHRDLTRSTKGKIDVGVKGERGAVADMLVCLASDAGAELRPVVLLDLAYRTFFRIKMIHKIHFGKFWHSDV